MGAGASTTLTVEQTDALCNAALAYSTEETSPPTLRVELQKYIRMRKVGVPLEACLQSMIVIGQQRDGLTTKDIQHFTTWCATHTEITQDDLARAFSSPARYNTEGESKHDNHAADWFSTFQLPGSRKAAASNFKIPCYCCYLGTGCTVCSLCTHPCNTLMSDV